MTQQEFQKIREKYPDAGRAYDGCDYCVGAGLCHEARLQDTGNFPNTLWIRSFPNTLWIRRALLVLNPQLDQDRAATHANAIVCYNDNGIISEAWNEAERALTYNGSDEATQVDCGAGI